MPDTDHFAQQPAGAPRPGQVVQAPPPGPLPQEYRHDGQPYPYYPNYDLPPEADGKIDIYKYLRIAVKYRWLIAGVALTTVVLAIVATFLMTPIYRATASVQIERDRLNVVDLKDVKPEESGQNSMEFLQTQYELLGSRSLAERVTASLGLVNDPSFNLSGGRLRLPFLKSAAADADADQPADLEIRARKTVDRLLKMLNIAPVRGSRIVKISIDHPNPALAQKIASGYAEAFIADNLDRRYDATSYARKFLEDRLQQLKIKLEDSERQAVKYAEAQGIINVDDSRNLASTDLEDVNKKLSEVRAERIKAEQLWKRAQATQGLGLKEILDSPAIQENRKLRSELAAQYQQKLAVYKPAFPEMVQLRNQVKELDRALATEVEAIKSSIEASYIAAKQQEEELAAQLTSTKSDVVDQRNRSIQYNILRREVDTNRTLYDGLLQRYKEIGVAGAVGANNISIVDKPTKPLLPRSPNLPINVLLALLGGIALGCIAAFLLDYIDDTFKSPEDIEREIGMPVIGVVPMPKTGTSVEQELHDQRSGMAEAIRSLRTGLQFATHDGLPKTLLVTSSKPSEGKTTTSIALARSLAEVGLNVLLIDGDLRNASIHRRLRCSNEMGLSNYLVGSKQPEQVVQSTTIDGLVLMASGPLPPNPAELLAGPRFASLLALSTGSFDVTLIDGPPVMGLADAPLLSSMAQATLLVVAANETRKSTVKVALKRLQFARASMVGALLNKFDASQTGYGYGYGEYEYHSYGARELAAPRA
jgi:polysaccharide biosynthesis transport protein